MGRSLAISLAIGFLLFRPSCLFADEPDDEVVDVPALVAKLGEGDDRTRESTAEKLATVVDERIEEPVRKRLEIEKDFHVRLALHYALAAQGDREALRPLLESLKRTGHLGVVYLHAVTQEDFEWNLEKWQEWFDETSSEQYKAFIVNRWKRKPMMDEWSKFAGLYHKQFFDKSLREDDPFTAKDAKALEELPTAKAWKLYETALEELQSNGNRKQASKLFRQVASEFSNTYYAEESKELADLLDKMIKEDESFTPPANVEGLPLKDRITYHIHMLRDVVAYQFVQPGECNVLDDGFVLLGEEPKKNAAMALRDIGEPAIPYLIEILNDRRPIRGVGYWRNFRPTREWSFAIRMPLRRSCRKFDRTVSMSLEPQVPTFQQSGPETVKS